MKSSHITILVMILLTIIGIGWDVVVIFNETPDDTISELLYEASIRWFILPFIFGMSAAHFFFPRMVALNAKAGAFNAVLAIGVVGVLNALSVWLLPDYSITWSHALSIACLLVGAGYGHLFWSNDRVDGK